MWIPVTREFGRHLFLQSVNTVVPASKVLSTAISLAQQITSNSPDAVQSSKVALLLSQKHNFPETFTTHNLSPESRRVYKGANIKVSSFILILVIFTWLKDLFFAFVIFQEGLKAFTEVSFYLLHVREKVICCVLFFFAHWRFRNVRQSGRILQSCNIFPERVSYTSKSKLKWLMIF